MSTNFFIHGSRSASLALMIKSGGQMMGGMGLALAHRLGPLTGEINLGGYDGPATDLPPCFGRLHKTPNARYMSNVYELDKIIKNYASRYPLASIQETVDEIKRILNRLTLVSYSNINLLLLQLGRLRVLCALHAKPQIFHQTFKTIQQKIQDTYPSVIDTLYLWALLPYVKRKPIKYGSDGNYNYSTKLHEINQNDLLVEKVCKLNQAFSQDNKLFQTIYEKPEKTIEDLKFVRDVLDLPEAERQQQYPHVEALATSTLPVCDEQEVREGAILAVLGYAVTGRNTDYGLRGYLFGCETSSPAAISAAAMRHINELQKLIGTAFKPDDWLSPLSLNKLDKNIIKLNFPVVFVSTQDDKFDHFDADEYRPKSSEKLCLGADIQVIATDTPKHMRLLRQYLKAKKLSHIQVISFDDLKQFRAVLDNPKNETENVKLKILNNLAARLRDYIQRRKTRLYYIINKLRNFFGLIDRTQKVEIAQEMLAYLDKNSSDTLKSEDPLIQFTLRLTAFNQRNHDLKETKWFNQRFTDGELGQLLSEAKEDAFLLLQTHCKKLEL